MNIDEIFSPTRLSQIWQPKGNKEVVSERRIEQTSTADKPLDFLKLLQKLIRERFSGDNLSTLNLLLGDVRIALESILESDKDRKEIDQTDLFCNIEEVLTQIEDLVEAFEIADQ